MGLYAQKELCKISPAGDFRADMPLFYFLIVLGPYPTHKLEMRTKVYFSKFLEQNLDSRNLKILYYIIPPSFASSAADMILLVLALRMQSRESHSVLLSIIFHIC